MPRCLSRRLCGALLLPLLPFAVRAQATGASTVSSMDIERAVQRNSARIDWPGFAPLSIPLAVFDGTRTTLFRHPSPPVEFSRTGADSVYTMLGRHPAITANSSADVGGHATATILTDRQRTAVPAEQLAAVALHESFHVYQRARHPRWSGNEGDLLTYPVDDARRLGLRRLETDALRRATEARQTADAACWARAFLAVRAARFDGLDSAFTRYERATELNEGLASYVQLRALATRTVPFPAVEFAPAALRLRTYTTGPAIALLLDQFAPAWKSTLEASDAQSLDDLLAGALPRTANARACAHSSAEQLSAIRTATRDSVALASDRAARRAAFDARTGYRIRVQAADGAPLWPQGFDPLNVERTDGGLLHTRFLTLGNAAGTMQLIDERSADVDALTVAAGAHPLFNGIRVVEVAGIGEPTVRMAGDTLTITAAGLSLSMRNARVERDGVRIRILLGPPRN